jgi:hypothetical protein
MKKAKIGFVVHIPNPWKSGLDSHVCQVQYTLSPDWSALKT